MQLTLQLPAYFSSNLGSCDPNAFSSVNRRLPSELQITSLLLSQRQLLHDTTYQNYQSSACPVLQHITTTTCSHCMQCHGQNWHAKIVPNTESVQRHSELQLLHVFEQECAGLAHGFQAQPALSSLSMPSNRPLSLEASSRARGSIASIIVLSINDLKFLADFRFW